MASTTTRTPLLIASFHDRPQLLHFDHANAKLDLESLPEPEFDGYTWISAHPRHKGIFYAAQRFSDKPGNLSIVKVSSSSSSESAGSSSKLEILKTYPSHGMDPCHLGLSQDASSIAIANYDSSTVTIYKLRAEDGLVDENAQVERINLSKEPFQTGPKAERQEAAHPHGCFFTSPQNAFLVPDLGADRLRVLPGSKTYPTKKGAGPRHAVVNPKINIAYVINELDNTLTLHDLASDDALPFASHSVLPSDAKKGGAGMCAAALVATPDYAYIYATNRLESHPDGDAIVWFRISKDGREATRLGELRSGLDHLRAAEIFAVEGQLFYIVGSKTETGAVVYKIDSSTGALSEFARNKDVVSPCGFVVV